MDDKYIDARMGGEKRYYLSPRGDINMRVPDEILKCVVFIGRDEGIERRYEATAFIVAKVEREWGTSHRFCYLVTAAHVAESIEGAPFWIRANSKGGSIVEIEANLKGEVTWHKHPEDDSVDVAVCNWNPEQDVDVLALDTKWFATQEVMLQNNIGIGDEVFISSLFSKVKGNSRNIPIIRLGNLAMTPNERIVPTRKGDAELFLIEARSVGGVSGSPAFIRQTVDMPGLVKWGTNEKATAVAYSNVFFLLGLVQGHWDVNASDINKSEIQHTEGGVNLGIAQVVPAQKILDVIDGPELGERRKSLMEEIKKKRQECAEDSA